MALEQKLSLKLAQRLVMTPSLQQAIKLLQMTRMEVETLVSQEMAENPLLEDRTEVLEKEKEKEKEKEEEKEEEKEKEEPEDPLDNIDLDAYFGEYFESSGYPSMREHRDNDFRPENNLTVEPDLYDHLLWQLHMTDAAPRQREIAEAIIGNLNPDGFLVASREEISGLGVAEDDHRIAADLGLHSEDNGLLDAALEALAGGGPVETRGERSPAESAPAEPPFGTATANARAERDGGGPGADGGDPPADPVETAVPGGYSLAEVDDALALVRSFDPPGIACHDLRESLLLQLEAAESRDGPSANGRSGETRALARTVVEGYWDLFLRRQFSTIAKKLGLDLHDLEPVVELVKTMETRPGRKFNSERTHYIEPDVHVYRVGDEYVIQLNDDGMPRLRVSHAYRRMLKKMRHDSSQADAKQYIKEKMRSAMWLIKSLDQRQRTIYKVARSIVDQQRSFLDHGIEHLRPMVLRDVAEDIDMHESTVSRVVSNKYIHTPRGVFPMKFFFHSGIDREYGENISSLTVKRKIEQLIEAEDGKKPLSDSELMRILNREGIQIARRTVAKYRDELGIPSSTDRKKIF